MAWRFAFFFLLIAFIAVNCNRGTQNAILPDTIRMLDPGEISSFHPEISVSLGWVPYQEKEMVPSGKNEWLVLDAHSNEREGKVPVILISYPGSTDSIYLDMDIDNALLGRLIKHSAITQQHIQRPFTTFFEESKCQKCHPPEVKVNFGN